ncbi:MAG: ATP-binding protein, partial [Bacteroidales bacterium]|nr:ATP-binding protein [Bacteroidales bacterium]
MAELFKYTTEVFMIFFDLIKKHLDEIIYGGILGGILTTFIIYFFKKIKYGILFLFSDVFKTKRQRLESIHIEGATVVNRQFLRKIKRIGLKQKYKAEDFYLAKQYENCQWYGILNNWDIERDAYKTIKEELKNSFADEFRQPKIIALILGRGGSGKSTLMRRVAVDSVQNDFCTLWLNDKEISIFYKSGINYIANYSKTKFLILIEDWYRIKQNTAHAKEIIDSLCNYSNVRIIIGDRTLDNSISKEHIFNPDENIIELKVNENKKTITEIIKKVTHWKETAESLLTRENDYNSTLYLILWVIARSYQDKNGIIEKNTIRKEGLSGHFQTIVESDLRNIEKHYPGFAKALYYYGSIYSQNRIYFGLDTFLNIADEFSEKAIDNRLAFTSKEIKPILNIYINITKGLFKSAGNLSLVAFNHDILTDEGLFKSQVAGWHRFDESILLRILPIIINNGDSFSASTYFYTTLNKISFEDFPNEDRLKHLNALIFDKKNRGYYLNSLINGTIIISENDKVSYITTILNDFLYFDFSTRAICNCLNHIKNHPAAQRAATAILSQPDFYKLPKEIVSTAMKICKDEAEQQKAATAILSQPDFYKLPLEIVSTAMNICKDEAEQQKATTAILSQPDFFKLP